MVETQKLEVNSAQNKRLAHIDFRVNYLGSISRNDLVDRFGIKEAAATRDFKDYKILAPHNIEYNPTEKKYVRLESFKSLFRFSQVQILTALSQGLGEDFVGQHKPFIPCEMPTQLNKPKLEMLSVLSRAIYQKKVVEITYRSLSSGQTQREIIPFVLVDNDLRWHVRAFDRRRKDFRDFVVTRIEKAQLSETEISEEESKENDIQWNRIVELEIRAHPDLTNLETIEYDYGMDDGVLKVNERATVVGYLLRQWNVDCSKDHSMRSKKDSSEAKAIHLWLSNPEALYGVASADIAPGYKK